MPSAIIVDDSPLMRTQLSKQLVTAGFSVVAEAGTGDEVLASYEQHRPALVTLELLMPGLEDPPGAPTTSQGDRYGR